MDVTVIVATFGAEHWRTTAQRAVASAEPQAPTIQIHGDTLHGARNAGGEQAATEWLCFLDADDELEPGYFTAMAKGTADLRGPAVRYQRQPNDRPVARVWPEQDLTDGNYLVIGTLVRRDLFMSVGGFRGWPLYEDWCLWQRCHRAGASIETIPTAVYRAWVSNRSRNRAPNRAEREHWHHAIRSANYPELYPELQEVAP